MTNQRELEEYARFTEEEVNELCVKYERDLEEMKSWYDGYSFLKVKSVYNPKAVVEACLSGVFDSYWTKTETYEALRSYIEMNYDGLRETVTQMLAGEHLHINTGRFANDMTTFENADDVLTLLVHLGYLSYDFEKEEVYIPNREISKEFYNAVEGAGWTEIANAVHNSKFTPFHWHCMQRDSIIQWSGNIQQEKDLQTLFLFREKSILKSRYY